MLDNFRICEFTATASTGLGSIWDANIVWDINSISGSILTYDPPSKKGSTMTFRYRKLPPSNSDFGEKTITAYHPDLPPICNTDSKTIEIYYRFDAINWPGADPNGGFQYRPPSYNLPYASPPYRFEYPNWHVHYSGTSADVGCDYNHNGGSSCDPQDDPNYTPYVGDLSNPHPVENYKDPRYSNPDIYIVNHNDVLYGIDVFAWAGKHEMKHHDDYTDWWGAAGHDPNNDPDGDYVPNEWPSSGIDYESQIPNSDGGPYDPNDEETHRHLTGGYTSADAADDQLECMFTQQYWAPASAIGEDWAYPGSRWH